MSESNRGRRAGKDDAGHGVEAGGEMRPRGESESLIDGAGPATPQGADSNAIPGATAFVCDRSGQVPVHRGEDILGSHPTDTDSSENGEESKVDTPGARWFSLETAERFVEGIGAAALLKREDEVELSAIIQELQARERLSAREAQLLAHAKERFVATNLRLVASIARRTHAGHVPLEDLIQEGNIGLMRAVELYDGRKGFRFSTYATWWIRQSISQAISEYRSEISLPRSLQQEFQTIQQSRLDLQQRLGREPRLEEVATASHMELFRVEEVLQYAQSVLSLEASPVTEGGSETRLGEAVPDRSSPPIEGTVAAQDLGRVVQIVLDKLEERERQILIYRFGLKGEDPHTIEQAAEYFGVSRERVRQVEARAISRLRRNESAQALREIIQDG